MEVSNNGFSRVKIYNISGDTLDTEVEYFDSMGRLSRHIYYKDSLLHGPELSYYSNKQLRSKGYWYKGKKTGDFNYYDSSGNLTQINTFIGMQRNAKDVMTEFIRLDKYGDTLKKSSFFYDLYTSADTVKYGESYSIKVVLLGKIFDSTELYLCNFDSSFNFKKNQKCAVFQLHGPEIAISAKPDKLGIDYCRGMLVNYQNYKENGKEKNKRIYSYFSIPIYVVK